MRHVLLAALAAALLAAGADTADAGNGANKKAQRFSQYRRWHGNYRYWHYQQPTAQVVPPTANTSRSLSWGVAQTEIHSIYHQYHRPYPGYGGGGDFSPYRTQPYWPSHTDQFGVYYVRGPWGHGQY